MARETLVLSHDNFSPSRQPLLPQPSRWRRAHWGSCHGNHGNNSCRVGGGIRLFIFYETFWVNSFWQGQLELVHRPAVRRQKTPLLLGSRRSSKHGLGEAQRGEQVGGVHLTCRRLLKPKAIWSFKKAKDSDECHILKQLFFCFVGTAKELFGQTLLGRGGGLGLNTHM